VQTCVTAGKHVVIAEVNTGFNTSTMFSSDNIHPNAAGYQFMAKRWYSVISALLPK
jgi:lysophospholipase L1-like esterase